jgi:hypothetical protein
MGSFYHNVYFWLQNPENEEDRIFFEASLRKMLSSSKFVVEYHIGVPAATDRPVIDRSYTFAAVMSFKNATDQDAYQEEQVHKNFLQECRPFWTKVIIYDSIEVHP